MLARLHRLLSRIRSAAAGGPDGKPAVLAVTPFYMDQLALRIASCNHGWNLIVCPSVESGLYIRQRCSISVIIYDLDTRDFPWRYGIRMLLSEGNQACVIALTDDPNDKLWQSILEFGIYDLQRRPLKDNGYLVDSVNAAHSLITSADFF
jgi:hypothetical protein